jgi:hypothetical protein
MMNKTVVSSMIIVAVLASGAFAGTLLDQITAIGVGNGIQFAHGNQTADSLQNLVVDNNQEVGNIAGERLFASIGQAVDAWADCGLIGATQDLDILGNQMQNIGDCVDPLAQAESLSMSALQTLSRANGVGAANGLHTIVLNAAQGGGNAAGTLDEATTVMGMQTSAIDGMPGATGAVQAAMTVLNTQTQASLTPVTQ